MSYANIVLQYAPDLADDVATGVMLAGDRVRGAVEREPNASNYVIARRLGIDKNTVKRQRTALGQSVFLSEEPGGRRRWLRPGGEHRSAAPDQGTTGDDRSQGFISF